jgi:hypothetical protein
LTREGTDEVCDESAGSESSSATNSQDSTNSLGNHGAGADPYPTAPSVDAPRGLVGIGQLLGHILLRFVWNFCRGGVSNVGNQTVAVGNPLSVDAG